MALTKALAQKTAARKAAAISVRVPQAVKQAAMRAARDDTRTVASYVERLIVEDLKARGLLKK